MEKSFIPPSPTRPVAFGGTFLDAVQTHLSLSTILLIGATLQTLLFLLPIRPVYALGLPAFFLLARFIQTILITYNYLPNPYLKNAIHKKFTAQVMDRDGNFPGPGKEKIAVMLLGAKSNHPLGLFAPDFVTTGKYLTTMNQELNTAPNQDSGFLGSTGFSRKDENGAIELIFMSYWRSIDDVHRFAHGPSHMAAWKWWETIVVKKHKFNHIGIMHEVYEAEAGLWEAMYVHFQPTMLGRTTYLKKDGKMVAGEVKEEWVSPILDASKGRLSSSNKRRGLGDSKEVEKLFADNLYANI